MQVYAVAVCCKNRTVLVFKKKYQGVFFRKKIINEQDRKRLNGAGSECFPGGKLERESLVNGALREFLEETGVSCVFRRKYEHHFFKGFSAVFFDLAPPDFDALYHSCSGRLNEKERLLLHLRQYTDREIKEALRKHDGRLFMARREKDIYVAWENILKTGICDDELESVRIVSVNEMPCGFTENSADTGWFWKIWQVLPSLLRSDFCLPPDTRK